MRGVKDEYSSVHVLKNQTIDHRAKSGSEQAMVSRDLDLLVVAGMTCRAVYNQYHGVYLSHLRVINRVMRLVTNKRMSIPTKATATLKLVLLFHAMLMYHHCVGIYYENVYREKKARVDQNMNRKRRKNQMLNELGSALIDEH